MLALSIEAYLLPDRCLSIAHHLFHFTLAAVEVDVQKGDLASSPL